MTRYSPEKPVEATRTLEAKDPILANVIRAVGPLKTKRKKPDFQSLCNIIVNQQLSSTVANRIFDRIARLAELSGGFLPEIFSQILMEMLCACGTSRSKAKYMLGFARLLQDNPTFFEWLETLEDKEAIKELTTLNGIGPWTASIFLMSCQGRVNVYPHGDVALERAVRQLYEMEPKKDKACYAEIINNWNPYRSIAARYLWAWIDRQAA